MSVTYFKSASDIPLLCPSLVALHCSCCPEELEQPCQQPPVVAAFYKPDLIFIPDPVKRIEDQPVKHILQPFFTSAYNTVEV